MDIYNTILHQSEESFHHVKNHLSMKWLFIELMVLNRTTTGISTGCLNLTVQFRLLQETTQTTGFLKKEVK